MSFPSSAGTRQDSLSLAWTSARSVAATIKDRATSLNTASLAGPVGSSAILDFATYLADAKANLQRAASTGGIAAYAQAQINDNTINIATEFSNMMTAIDGITSWIITNFPKDTVSGTFLLAKQFAGDNSGRTTDRTFTTAQLAGLRTALNTLIAAID